MMRGKTVLDATVHRPRTSRPGPMVADVRELFPDDQVDAAQIVVDCGRLLSVIDRTDLERTWRSMRSHRDDDLCARACP